jgi:GNAT superfamily N-acetyltransferase
MVDIRRLRDALDIVAQIDRSEQIETTYRLVDGELTTEAVHWDVPTWPDGDGPHSIGELDKFLRPIVDRGGVLLGAYVDSAVAGVAVVETGFEAAMTWLAFLHVSRPHRRSGVATALWEETVRLARLAGDTSIYVSATPSGSAVGFYLSRGCVLADPPHAALFDLEPEDIHLLCRIA